MPDAEELAAFVERYAEALTLAGWPRMMSRVFARLMAAEGGRSTAAELSQALGVGAPAISGGIKPLLQLGLVTREREPGDRRDYYRVQEDAWFRAVAGNDATLARWQEASEAGVRLLGTDTEAGRRFEETRRFFAFLREELPRLMDRWHDAQR
ncbi:MarR family transcriptional regulator [Auraticoccus sp. F435]|uniref:MarR family transcriptional regulator n=1 Tax=Auraticoccus cholistanensis TaxID=2656650 RepID=A0A6A9UWC9_9ACTN|nr:MarR family transcriptional regulator [Auraticoccus cholistanensis]MVA75884.1 MarR family transcriptional regulator [Auraticoccus cholistanensis]